MLLQDLTNKNRWGEIFILSIFEDNLQLLRDSFNYYYFFFYYQSQPQNDTLTEGVYS